MNENNEAENNISPLTTPNLPPRFAIFWNIVSAASIPF
jgi:hypothetical protein